MYASALIPFSRRWLPVLVLLVALAQLTTAAHQHEGEHQLVDCGLCLQHTGLKHLHGGYSMPLLPAIARFLPAVSVQPAAVLLPAIARHAIRAPPLPTPLFTI